ncbi:MAG: helix-hairpin-helix domain-containing protein [Deltaproteobacteria bacterium]|nr:helix-hairpin-helix domain-containing protein [Deltaproteobacteria bacterium]
MVKKELVKDISDLYYLTKDDLLGLDGFADKSARQLYEAIQEAKNPRLDRFLFALGIRHVGQGVARTLADEFNHFEALKKSQKDALEAIPEIGSEIAESVIAFFSQKENLRVLKRLKQAGVDVQAMHREKKSRSLKGQTFVFTGKLEEFSRQDAKVRVEDLGGRATSGVSGETDYVVVGENPGSKYDEARKQGVKIIDEKGFKKLISS